jgi:hypothetical protein
VRGHNLHGRGWIAALAIVLLIVAHAVLFGVATRLHYSVLLAAGVVGIVVLKYGWWKLRR